MKLKSLMNDFIQNYLDENAIKFEDWNISTNNQDGFGDYSSNIACAVEKQNIFGCQFHPEKSDKTGLKIINNFINL